MRDKNLPVLFLNLLRSKVKWKFFLGCKHNARVDSFEGFWRVSKDKKVKTVVKAIPEASVEHMFDYIKPTIKHHPEEIILHLGTNDLKKSDSRQVA